MLRAAVAVMAMAFSTAAHAQGAQPGISGDGWIAIAIILGLVVLIILLIRGSISITRDEPDDDSAGFGVLEGIEEDEADEERRRKKK
jgi:uncharacterized membrane protein